ncbi:Fanconi anemia group I protein-like [Centruroides sculpturatus]|uniref:Fanconi anemia group I protein-like n=1 Tax=Centruroides sculpturatus TaxID=218467 RepID=UPI000C6D40A0|nr:Fanconi anemia group I protein-like [Centruroides sculpturatus]
MTGTEYRSHLIKCLCLNKWEPECAVQVASTFREVALSNEELQWLIEKLLKVLQEVEMQEIPTLVYQLLLLSSKGFRKQLLEKILFYFKNQADILKKQKLNRDRNKENESMHSNDTIKHIEGTVILHITFAAKQDQEIGKEFVKLLKNEGYCLQQVFNADETGLFWKKMPNRTFIIKEEKTLLGHKPMKDRLTLLFAANASGDLKIKPLLIYHSENPRVFKKNHIVKSNLSVHWKSNQKAWVTQVVFKE